MFNKVVLVGNLTRDIEMRYGQNGSAIGSCAIAVTRRFSINGEKREETCFIDITFFGRTAEIANQYLSKGSKVLIEGRLKLDTWTDQNGQNRSKHSIQVENLEMLNQNMQNTSNFNNQSYDPYTNEIPQQERVNKNLNKNNQNQKKEKMKEIDVDAYESDDTELPF